MTTATGLLAILAFFAAFVAYRCLIKPLFSPLRAIPITDWPRPLWKSWIFGHLLTVSKEPPGHPPLRWAKAHGLIVRFQWFLGSSRVLVADPEALKDILVTKTDVFHKPEAGVRAAVLGNEA